LLIFRPLTPEMLNYEDVKNTFEVLNSLDQPNRLRIIELLHKHTELTVTDLCAHMALDQGLVSHHLRILTKIQVIEMRKNGKYTHYSLNYMRWVLVKSVVNDLAHL
jgi:ArsR family transcriptional regulator